MNCLIFYFNKSWLTVVVRDNIIETHLTHFLLPIKSIVAYILVRVHTGYRLWCMHRCPVQAILSFMCGGAWVAPVWWWCRGVSDSYTSIGKCCRVPLYAGTQVVSVWAGEIEEYLNREPTPGVQQRFGSVRSLFNSTMSPSPFTPAAQHSPPQIHTWL